MSKRSKRSKRNQPLIRKDFLAQLPKEIAYRIIAHLTPHDLMSCAGVSRTWQRICEDDQTWRQKCFENGYVEFDAPSFRFLGGWAVKRANEQAGICSHMDLQEAHQNRQAREIAYGQCYERSPWKSLYLRKKRIISNWRSRAIQSSTVLDDDLLYQVLYQKNQSARIITSFHDYKLRVWNAGDAQPAFTLSGQRGSGYSYQGSEDGKYIVSSESDGTVRVLCGKTGAELHFLTDLILCMSLHGTTLVSGSSDLTLRVWDIVDGKCLHILAIEAEAYFVKFDGKRVVFIGHGFTVNVWIIHTEECLHTLTGHTGPVDSLLFEPERGLVVSGSSDDGTIRVWDVQRGTCIALIGCRHNLRYTGNRFGMQLRGNNLVCHYGSDVWVWDIREGGSCLHHLHGGNGQTSTITSLQLLDSGLLVTGSRNGSVKLWDVKKGTFVRDLVRSRWGDPGRYYCNLKASETLLVCGVRSVEEAKLILIDLDASYP